MGAYDALAISQVAEWRSGFDPKPDLLATVAHWVGLPRVMVTLEVILPTFVVVRGCVLLPWSVDETALDDWWVQLDGDTKRIEEVLNHLHLWDLEAGQMKLEAEEIERLGAILADSWTWRLREQIPNRSFQVVFSNDAESDYGPTVSIRST